MQKSNTVTHCLGSELEKGGLVHLQLTWSWAEGDSTLCRDPVLINGKSIWLIGDCPKFRLNWIWAEDAFCFQSAVPPWIWYSHLSVLPVLSWHTGQIHQLIIVLDFSVATVCRWQEQTEELFVYVWFWYESDGAGVCVKWASEGCGLGAGLIFTFPDFCCVSGRIVAS